MKSSIFALLSTVGALVGPSAMASAAPASDLELFQKALGRRVANERIKSGICVCQGGSMHGDTGIIIAGAGTDIADNLVFVVKCIATVFDEETTGEINDQEVCDEGWTPLPQ